MDGSENIDLSYLKEIPKLGEVEIYIEYTLISGKRRDFYMMKKYTRLIEQSQYQLFKINPSLNRFPSFDVRFSNSIKALFFGITNLQRNTIEKENPVSHFSLLYEKISRLTNIGTDYFSLVNPWYHAPNIPKENGYNMYSYTLDINSIDPKGSTNYSTLTNVNVVFNLNRNFPFNKSDKLYILCISTNIMKIEGGVLTVLKDYVSN